MSDCEEKIEIEIEIPSAARGKLLRRKLLQLFGKNGGNHFCHYGFLFILSSIQHILRKLPLVLARVRDMFGPISQMSQKCSYAHKSQGVKRILALIYKFVRQTLVCQFDNNKNSKLEFFLFFRISTPPVRQ